MWSDQETDQDFLNFSGVAETVAEIIVRANGRPISIGVAGAWGVGKSSMIKLIQAALRARKKEQVGEFVFVPFNAWLYQGYDDARAALLQVIADTLLAEAGRRNKGIGKAKELLARVDWLRAAKLLANLVSAAALAGATLFSNEPSKRKKDATTAPPHEIDAIRKNFEEANLCAGVRPLPSTRNLMSSPFRCGAEHEPAPVPAHERPVPEQSCPVAPVLKL